MEQLFLYFTLIYPTLLEEEQWWKKLGSTKSTTKFTKLKYKSQYHTMKILHYIGTYTDVLSTKCT